MSRFNILFLSLLLAACGSSKKAVQLDTITVKASDDTYRPTATMAWDITHTDVALDFNFAERTANGKAIITMHPYFYSSNHIVLDAKSMKINSLLVNGKKNSMNYQNDSLIIYLDRNYHRTESVTVEVGYTAMPYAKATSGGNAISDDKGLYFINTNNEIPNKPFQVWTQGETESNSFWVPTFDKPNERFTTSIQLTVPDTLKTLSNGVFKGSKDAGTGMRTDKWEMDMNIQPYVMMFAIGNYTVVEDAAWRGKKVNYYVEPEYAPHALEMFKNTPEMMEFFSNVTGVPYPWNKYSQVVVRDYVSGAMENTSATVFGEFINQTGREIKDANHEDIVSHELFHQWFGDYVTAESWSNLTVNESFATYGEQLWRRYKYGKASAQKLGYEDMMIYLRQSKGNDEPLTRFHYKKRDDMFDRISYQKGATILHYLHGLMGDSAFYHAMNIYLTENALQPAEAHHWRLAVEKATGKDWNWFFNQWYFRGGHPVLEVKYVFDDAKKQVKIQLDQTQPSLYTLPLKLDVVSKNNTFSDTITMDSRSMTVTYPYYDNERPSIFTDAEHWLIGELKDTKTAEHWLATYKACKKEDFIAKIRALQNTSNILNNAQVQEMYKLALNDNLEHVKVYTLNYLQIQKLTNTQNTFKDIVLSLAKNDASNHVRAAAFDVLTAWKVKADKEMYAALNDESYKVAAAALAGIYETNKDTAYSIAKSIYKTEPGGNLESTVWEVIFAKGETTDTTLIKDLMYKVGGKNKVNLTVALTEYMINTPSDAAFSVALKTVEFLGLSEAIAPYRSIIGEDIYTVADFFKKELANGGSKGNQAKVNTRLNLLLQTFKNLENKETAQDNLSQLRRYQNEIQGKKS